MTEHPKHEDGVHITGADCEEFSHALADTLCWFRGFRAAHIGRDDQPDLPPGIDALRDLNIVLKKGF